ncbi:transposase domain-containing protein [Escherichia coli]
MIGQCESAIEYDANRRSNTMRFLQHARLTDVLTRLPEWPEDRLAELLPLEGFTLSG